MRTTDLFRVLAVAVVAAALLAVGPARLTAAEVHKGDSPAPGHADAKGGGAHGDGSGGHAPGGLSFTGFERYDLGIWTLLVFFILLAVLSKYAWPFIKQGLEMREATILNAHEEAKKDRLAAEQRLAEAKRQLDEAALQAKAIVDEARKAADALKVAEREAGVKEAEAKRQQAEREIAATREAMVKDLYEKAVQLATLMSEKALRREVSAADHSRLLDESLAELRAASKA